MLSERERRGDDGGGPCSRVAATSSPSTGVRPARVALPHSALMPCAACGLIVRRAPRSWQVPWRPLPQPLEGRGLAQAHRHGWQPRRLADEGERGEQHRTPRGSAGRRNRTGRSSAGSASSRSSSTPRSAWLIGSATKAARRAGSSVMTMPGTTGQCNRRFALQWPAFPKASRWSTCCAATGPSANR